jgi:hypothetical protein
MQPRVYGELPNAVLTVRLEFCCSSVRLAQLGMPPHML